MIRRLLLVAVFCLLGVAPAWSQAGSRKDDVVLRGDGRPAAGANIRVCTFSATGLPCSPLASIFSDLALTQAKSNPFPADSFGNYSFYAAEGRYIIQITVGSTTLEQRDVILPCDPSTSCSGGGGGGDNITVGTVPAVDPDFIDTSTIDFVLDTGATPDTIAANIKSASVTDAMLASNYSGVGACTNQAVTATNDNAAPTCSTITSAFTSGSFLADNPFYDIRIVDDLDFTTIDAAEADCTTASCLILVRSSEATGNVTRSTWNETAAILDLRGDEVDPFSIGDFFSPFKLIQRKTADTPADLDVFATGRFLLLHDSGGDNTGGGPKDQYHAVAADLISAGKGEDHAVRAVTNKYGEGDALGIIATAKNYGNCLESGGECTDGGRFAARQGTEVMTATVDSYTGGSRTIAYSGAANENTRGVGRYIINTTGAKVYSTGSITSISTTTPATVEGSGTLWATQFTAGAHTDLCFSQGDDDAAGFKFVVPIRSITDEDTLVLDFDPQATDKGWPGDAGGSATYRIYKCAQIETVNFAGGSFTHATGGTTDWAATDTLEVPLGWAWYGAAGRFIVTNDLPSYEARGITITQSGEEPLRDAIAVSGKSYFGLTFDNTWSCWASGTSCSQGLTTAIRLTNPPTVGLAYVTTASGDNIVLRLNDAVATTGNLRLLMNPTNNEWRFDHDNTTANAISLFPLAGFIQVKRVTAPATGAANEGRIYFNTGDNSLQFKADTGDVSNTVIPFGGAPNNFLTGISAAGFIASAQPSFTNISGTATVAQWSPLTTNGDLVYHNGTTTTRLARGTDTQCLTSNATTILWGSCGAGGGITSLNALTAATQLFADVDDTNVTLAISSVTDTHTFTVGWTGTLAKARQNAATAYTDQANTFGAFLQAFQSGANFELRDPTDTTKRAQFGLSNIGTGLTRTVNIPNANSTTAQALTAPANQFFTAMSVQGVFSAAQPAFSDISGTADPDQLGGGVAADDKVLVADSASGATWRAIPTCNTVTEKTHYNTATNTWTCETDAGGGGGGDNITVNAVAATDANFNDTLPAAPGSGVNVEWQLDTATTPDNVSGYIQEASVTQGGVVNTVAQTFNGEKTFDDGVIAPSYKTTNATLPTAGNFRMGEGDILRARVNVNASEIAMQIFDFATDDPTFQFLDPADPLTSSGGAAPFTMVPLFGEYRFGQYADLQCGDSLGFYGLYVHENVSVSYGPNCVTDHQHAMRVMKVWSTDATDGGHEEAALQVVAGIGTTGVQSGSTSGNAILVEPDYEGGSGSTTPNLRGIFIRPTAGQLVSPTGTVTAWDNIAVSYENMSLVPTVGTITDINLASVTLDASFTTSRGLFIGKRAGATTNIGALVQMGAATTALELENPDTPADNSFLDSPDFIFTGVYDSDAGAPVVRAEEQWRLFVDVTATTPASTLTFSQGGAVATLTDAGTFNATTLTESGNAVPNATDNLGFFAATTSAQLAVVLSDETGSGGGFVRATDPAFTNFADFTAIAAPATPGAGVGRLYFKSSTKMFCGKDDAGVETCMDAGTGGATSWSGLTDPTAAVLMTSNATAETATFSFESAFTTGDQFLIRQQTGDPTGGTLFAVRATDVSVTELGRFDHGGDANAFFVVDSGSTAAQISAVGLYDRNVSKWTVRKTAGNDFALFDEAASGNRMLLTPSGNSAYQTGSTTTDHVFENFSNVERFRIMGDADAVALGAGEDTRLTRSAAGVVGVTSIVDVATGLRVAGAATTGRYLRGNATNFVVSAGAASGTGSCTNQFARTLNDDAAPTCASVATADITDANVTFAKLQDITTDRLLGRDTAATGDVEEISLNATLEFTGAGAIQRAALTGDVTASAGSNTTAIASGVVTPAKVSAPLKTRLIQFMLGADNGAVLADTDDQQTIFVNRLGSGLTITEVWCESDGGTPSINLQRDDGTPANILSANLSCSTSGASTTTFVAGESAISDTHRIDFVMVTAGGVAKRITLSIKATVD